MPDLLEVEVPVLVLVRNDFEEDEGAIRRDEDGLDLVPPVAEAGVGRMGVAEEDHRFEPDEPTRVRHRGGCRLRETNGQVVSCR